jgi:hypothetical protein
MVLEVAAMQRFQSLLIVVGMSLVLVACAPQATPQVAQETFSVGQIILPSVIPYGERGSGRIFYRGAPALPLTVTTTNIACTIAERCGSSQFTVDAGQIEDSSFAFRYNCELEDRQARVAIDDVVITDANGVSTPRARYVVMCVP